MLSRSVQGKEDLRACVCVCVSCSVVVCTPSIVAWALRLHRLACLGHGLDGAAVHHQRWLHLPDLLFSHTCVRPYLLPQHCSCAAHCSPHRPPPTPCLVLGAWL